MKLRIVLPVPLLSILLLACNNNDQKRNVFYIEDETLETEMYGTYQALLSPINKIVSGHLNGSLTLVREKSEFIADVRLSGGRKSVLHTQNIHIGSRCPTEEDDLNRDGYVDAEEASGIYQEALIPLDDDLSSQRMGAGIYPMTDDYGYYFWSRSTSYEKLINDLREEDINLKDDIAKLPIGRPLIVLEKVVVIRGIPETTLLPETVQGRGRLNAHQALPIACGVIRRLDKAPGVIDTDSTSIPVPEGETVGGSSGADDGANFSRGTTVGNTGNYGDEDDIRTTTNSSTTNGTTSGEWH